MRLSLYLGLVYFVSEVLLTITRRGRSKTGEKQDRSTLRVLWIVIMISIGAGVFIAGNSAHSTSLRVNWGPMVHDSRHQSIRGGRDLSLVGDCDTREIFHGGRNDRSASVT